MNTASLSFGLSIHVVLHLFAVDGFFAWSLPYLLLVGRVAKAVGRRGLDILFTPNVLTSAHRQRGYAMFSTAIHDPDIRITHMPSYLTVAISGFHELGRFFFIEQA